MALSVLTLLGLLQLFSHALCQSNEHPIFDDATHTVNVLEDHNTSLPILSNFKATDFEKDPIKYYIGEQNLGSDSFDIVTVANESFELYFKDSVTLDREARDEYVVIVHATDEQDHGDAEDNSIEIEVNIKDINDEKPLFQNLPKTVVFTESTNVNTEIYNVDATDDDIGKNAQIRYFISSVTPSLGIDKFGIYVSSGEIYLKNSLDYETTTRFFITVLAQDRGDPPLSSSEELTVDVTDANDQLPAFSQIEYSEQIYENATIGTPILQVTAKDQDVMINDGIVYSIETSLPVINNQTLFIIDNITGVISVNAELDADEGAPSSYTFNVKGTEISDSSKFDKVTVKITVLDINDNPPEFEKAAYNNSLSELSSIGTIVVTVMAVDQDQGANARFTFELINLLATPLPFNITQSSDGESGHVQLTDDLDYEAYEKYVFEVRATEIVNDKTKTASTTVTVTVINVNDEGPVFSKTEYFTSISENAGMGAYVGQVSANDKDQGTFGVVYYYLLNYQDTFEIDQTTGVITLEMGVDYEEVSTLSLLVGANDSATPLSAQRMTSVQVQVQVLDFNDNGPVISINGSTSIKVEEEQEAGVLIYVVVADDADDPPNDDLDYFIKVLEPSDLSEDHFEYSEVSRNQLVTKVPLNYEDIKYYELRLYVTDLGNLLDNQMGSGLGSGMDSDSEYESVTDLPPDHVDYIDILINVIDENDNTPKFVGGVTGYTYDVDEEQPANTKVGSANATDSDSGLFGTVRYSISGVGHENFTIDHVTGEVFTAGPINREQKDRFDLIVTAYDLGNATRLSASVDLTITITDINDNIPKFQQPIYVENDVYENTISFSIQVSATDADIDENDDLTYEIVDGNFDDQFMIDPTSGLITLNTAVTLDREINPKFNLIIRVTDDGMPSLASNATVIIEIQDVNDNKPLFEQNIYEVNITEGTQIGSQVATVKANDKDIGPNGIIRYSIKDGIDKSNFDIDVTSGIITTKTKFDVDADKSKYSLTIVAEDNGEAAKSSVAQVVITILDVNDNSPEFTKSQYKSQKSENIAGGALIATIKATDVDSDELNKMITYTITGVTIIGSAIPSDAEANKTDELFTLEPDNGNLYLSSNRSFDFESVTGYNVLVQAEDGGNPPREDSSVVLVTILDYNDNHPVLSAQTYSLSLSEDTDEGTTYSLFSYTDSDSGANAVATYSLENTSIFSINKDTGVLQLMSALDYETTQYFEFTVVVTDGGNPSLSDRAEVNVAVSDVNDNGPVFVSPPAPFAVNINLNESNYTASMDMILYTFNATDKDDGQNGVVTYSITSGDTLLFSIDSDSGEFTVIGNIDRENEDFYELTITATDGGSPASTATSTISISILDKNEQPPSFLADSYSETISENNAFNISLVTVVAEDPDLGNVYYSLNDTTNFMIMPDGEIKAKTQFDYEEAKSISVLVTATDEDGLGSSVVFTVFITDENDNKPKFMTSYYDPFVVLENQTAGFFLASGEATDSDSGANGDVTYQVAGAKGKFAIDSNGHITLQSSLDRETEDFYRLLVTAVDHGTPQQSSTLEINVTVADVNDKDPMFGANFYSVGIPENETILTTIQTVDATDADLGKNAELSFEIVGGNSDSVFSISTSYDVANHKYIGNILLEKNLDFETTTSYSLQIMASDMGTYVVRTSTAHISITVQNVNDELPEFSPSNVYSFSISEIAPSGTPVGTVLATDDDAGKFGKITSYNFAPNTPSDVIKNFELSFTGVITLASGSNIDFDSNKTSYMFSIVATDGGGLSSTASVTVNVVGHNEEAPSFQKQSYNGSVLENLPVDHLVVTVKATDPDNSPITYEIVEGNENNRFKIDSAGRIKTNELLDREDKEVYILRIRASDNDQNPLYGFTQVEIIVQDVNDNYPKFPATNAEYQLVETTPLTTILSPVIVATDKDKDENSEIAYSGGEPGVFNVNSTTGYITLLSDLNFETNSKYVFQVFAHDGGSPPKSDNITIEVNVLDFNDNEPLFEFKKYTKSIDEGIQIGGVVVTVFANDSDSGVNAEIVYSIDTSDTFEIDSNGVITTTDTLDYETTTQYLITVTATDKGNSPKSSLAIVELNILDANDNGPEFDKLVYTYNVKEQSVPDDLYLLSVSALDRDGTSPNNVLTYNITKGNSALKFRIDANGTIYATKDLDREEENEYTLTVMAMDSPTSPSDTKYNTTEVIINIEDVNDNSPVWSETSYRVTPNQFAGAILESVNADTLVVYVEATDKDSGLFGTVTYSFLTPSNKFYINGTSGYVYTYGNLDSDVISFYNLTIVASDGGSKSTTGYLSIEVIDINDREPSFISSFFYKSVSEGVDLSYSVVTLAAFDSDSVDLEYSITDGNSKGFFQINSSSGEVGLAKKLDREEEDDFLLEIFVSDGTFNDTANLRVVVTDINDNPPGFIDSPYFAYIDENTVSGPVLLYNSDNNTTRVQAFDPDEPDSPNSIVVYETFGTNKDILNIAPSTGVLTVASGAMLDYEGDQTVVVNILAHDTVDPPGVKSSESTITIHVQDTNDKNPVFVKGSYSSELKEGESIGTVVIDSIEAMDEDTGLGGIITYSIVSSDPSTHLDDFTINGTTGVVTLVEQLDREEANEISLTIRATDNSSPFNSGEVQLTVVVTDINDNIPVFNQSSYYKEIAEDIGMGGNVLTVQATDKDENFNGDVSYSLLNYNDVFHINADTGVISTISTLDHESVDLYIVIAQACDDGNPTILCGNVSITISINDVNDVTPSFDYDVYYTTICDDSTPVTDALQVIAVDKDSGDYGKVTYTLASGSDLGTLFTLDQENGEITLVNNIEPSNIGTTLSVDIVASDGGNPQLTSETEVQITICDKQNALIYFNESLYYGAVEENGMAPTYVTTISAITPNPPVSYFIVPPKVDNHFNISLTTGVIETSVMLDREERETYSLVVKAVDSGSPANTAYTTITIAILDVNDHPPRFLPTSSYSFTLTEEQTAQVIVSTIVAIDPDQPFDPTGVQYSLESASNPDGVFSIDENGTIYANKPVDREQTQSYKLKIRATDADPSDPRITTATATITILDINDNRPLFEQDIYNESVSENHPPNFPVLKVAAIDKDADLNKEMEYSIVSGDKGNFFVDSNTGVLKTINQLDFEVDPFYNITVRARDKGNPSMSSSATVLVIVEDYNDCTPMFTDNKYAKELPETFGLGTILDIDVTDCDSGENKKITYSIVSGNNDNRFELDPTSGVLSLKNSLDYESETSYLIQIKATDGGTPALSNLTLVEIGITDINDETPVFNMKDGYSLDLPEDRNVGYEIIVVTANDDDESVINSELVYSIKSGDDDGDFKIDSSTGSIKIEKELDRETKDSYLMVIEVSDTGSPPRSANTTLSLIILDVNDNPPIIVEPAAAAGTDVAVLENTTKSEVVYTVRATDEDSTDNAQLQYSLQNYKDVFSIHPSTGVIKLIAELDYDQSIREYQLSIEATDLAIDVDSRLTDHATLNIIVQDINDHNPVFDEDKYETSEPEEQNPGQEFVTVRATDGDGTVENNRITYFISECSPACDNSFEIDGNIGVITNSKKLDRESNDRYELKILAINVGAYPERNDSSTVIITITDINDHHPEFNQTMYQATITEGIQPNTKVLSVFATDEDQQNSINSEVTYKILTVIPNNPFSLNENSGSLEVTGNIDREMISFYNFTVRVEDNGETKLYNDAQVTVTVEDENDQPPVFVNNLQSVRVNEGTSISNFPYFLWSAGYTDGDQLGDNRWSQFNLLSVLNGSTPIGSASSLILLNQTTGEVFLISPVDFETTKDLTILLSVNNTKSGVGELCGGFDKACSLSDSAKLNVEITDYNDNGPEFVESTYTGQVSTVADPGTQIRQIIATDRDSQNNYGTVRYRLSEGSSTKFKIESETGWVVTRGTFENDDGKEFEIEIEAYDNLGEDPTRVSTVKMNILALSNFKRVLIVFNRRLTNFTEIKEKFIVDTLHNLTGYTIVVEEIREHLLDDVGDVDSSKTDFIFHAVNANGEIVEFDVFIKNLNVELFFDLIRECSPEKITSLQTEEDYPPVELIMRFLIGLCGFIAIGAIVVLVLACEQRHIALNSMWKNQIRDEFYGSADPSLIEGRVPRDLSGETFEMRGRSTKSPLYVEPYSNYGPLDSSAVGESSIGDISSMQQENPLYEEQELRMDMFEPSDDETEGDFDGENPLAEALKDNESDSGSVTAI